MFGVNGTYTHDVRVGQQCLKPRAFNVAPRRIVLGEERIMGQHPHTQRLGTPGSLPQNPAESDQAEYLATDLTAHAALARPLTVDDVGRGLIGIAQQHHRRGNDVLGYSNIVGPSGRTHLDAAPLTGIEIDIVQADTETPNHLQRSGCVKQGTADLGTVANHQRPGTGNRRCQCVRMIDQTRVVRYVTSNTAERSSTAA